MRNLHLRSGLLAALVSLTTTLVFSSETTTATAPVTSEPEMRLLGPAELAGQPAQSDRQTTLIAAPIEPEKFMAVLRPTLNRSSQMSTVHERHVMLTASAEEIGRAAKLTEEIRTVISSHDAPMILRATLLTSGDLQSSPTDSAPAGMLPGVLASYGMALDDLRDLPVTGSLCRQGDTSLPIASGSTVRTHVGDVTEIVLSLDRESKANAYQVELSVHDLRKGTGQPPLVENRFFMREGKPVVIGLSHPTRTMLLMMVIQRATP